MEFKLTEVLGWRDDVLCVSTTLSAITGLHPDSACEIAARAASERTGEKVFARSCDTYNVVDWLQAIIDLGGDYSKIENYHMQFKLERLWWNDQPLHPNLVDELANIPWKTLGSVDEFTTDELFGIP
jgi:hypothetical protein